tara:strand:- start:30621 stop:32402 length:1782 start_codon:yes stop_codon:yes gene_type:complete
MLLGTLLPAQIFAEPVHLGPDFYFENLRAHCELIIIPASLKTKRPLSIRTIQQRSDWRPCSELSLSRGYSNEVVWLRTRIINDTNLDQILFLESTPPWISEVDVFQVNEKGTILFQRSYGSGRPFYERDFAVPPIYAPITVRQKSTDEVYVRLHSQGSLPINLAIHSTESFEKDRTFWSTFNGILMGGVALLILYNLAVYWSIRDPDYLVYVLFAFWGTLFLGAVYGYNFQFFWPAWPEAHLRITWISIGLGSASMILMARRFLNLKTYMPWAAKGFLVLIYSGLLIAALAWPFAHSRLLQIIANGHGVLSAFLSLGVTGYGVVRKLPGSRIFLGAWLFLLMSLASIGLVNRGVFEFSETLHRAGGFALIANLTLLSFALADKIRQIHREKDRAEERTRRILEASKADLERKVARRTADLEQARQSAEYLASIDVLTGLKNRRALFELGRALLSTSQESESPLTDILLDLDHFKIINDTHGHATGDEVLRTVGGILGDAVDGHDVVGRLGGEEFLILRAGEGMNEASTFAEALREQIDSLGFPVSDGILSTSASFGLADVRKDERLEDVLTRADAALYAAKDQGRNQVVQFGN